MKESVYQDVYSKHLKILALATEWGVSQGGVSVWNMEFCRALSIAGHRVTCGLVSELGATLNDASIATINAQYGPPKSLLTEAFDLIVGHGLHTGPYAKFYRDEYFATAQYIHVQHVDHVIEQDKCDNMNIKKVDDKESQSRQLLAAADIAIGVGPRLALTAERLLASAEQQTPIIRLDPGVPSYILNASPRRAKRCNTRMLLVVGRADDWKLKGFDIASKAAAILNPSMIDCLRIRGVNPTRAKELKQSLTGSIRKSGLQLDLRPFEGPRSVLTDFMEADCVLLPSRREGFGLSAFESLCLGVPTLVTQASGLADLLTEKCPTSIAQHIVVTGSDAEVWAERVKWATDPVNTVIFQEVRRILTESCTWDQSIQHLINSVNYGH